MSLKARLTEIIPTMRHEAYAMVDARNFQQKLDCNDLDAIDEALRDLSEGEGALLERWGIIFTADDEHVIDGEDFAEFEQSGILVHPESGDIIPSEHLKVYYAIRSPEPAGVEP
jgi:hypothetical protein